MTAREKEWAERDEIQKQLLWLLMMLWGKGRQLSCASLTLVVDELQKLLDAQPKAAGMITPFIERIIASLAIFSECLRQIELYQPWALSFDLETDYRKEDLNERLAQRANVWDGMITALEKSNRGNKYELSTFGKPAGGRFDYPIARRRNEENVERMRYAERNLNAFWDEVIRILTMGAGGDLGGTALGKLLAEPRALLRTPPWLPSAKRKPQPQVSAIVDTTKPLSELSFGLESWTSINPSKRAAQAGLFKQKIKTRGTPMPSTDPRSAIDLPEEQEGLKQHGTIVVDARALKVFRIVFFQPFIGASLGEVAWKNFVRALVSTGFEAQKLYGSVWQFTPGSNPAASTVPGSPEQRGAALERERKEQDDEKYSVPRESPGQDFVSYG